MRIAVIDTGFSANGFNGHMVASFVKAGHEVCVYTETPRAPDSKRLHLIQAGNPAIYAIHHIKRNPYLWLLDKLFKPLLGRRFFTTLLMVRRFIRQTQDYDVHVVESDWMGFFALLGSLKTNVRLVIGVHDWDHLRLTFDYPYHLYSAHRALIKRFTLNRADLVRCNSFVTRDLLKQGGITNPKLCVLPLPFDPVSPPLPDDLETYRSQCRSAIIQKHGLPAHATILLTMSRLVPSKGLDTAIHLLSALLRDDPNTWLLICGKDRAIPKMGSYHAHLAKIVESVGVSHRVLFPGFIPPDEARVYYAAADIHLALSVAETYGFSVIEATYWGTPTITFPRVGAAHWMHSAGIGVVASDISLDSLYRTARQLLQHPPEAAVRVRANQWVASNLSSQALAASYLAAYRTMNCRQ